MGILKAILRDETAATAIEYALLIALIALTTMIGMNTFKNSVFKLWHYVDNTTSTAIAKSNEGGN